MVTANAKLLPVIHAPVETPPAGTEPFTEMIGVGTEEAIKVNPANEYVVASFSVTTILPLAALDGMVVLIVVPSLLTLNEPTEIPAIVTPVTNEVPVPSAKPVPVIVNDAPAAAEVGAIAVIL